MHKIYITLTLMFGLLCSFPSNGQTTFFTENFGNSGCTIPSGWSSAGGINWDYATTDPGRGPGGDNTTGTGCYAQMDDSDGAAARHLTTPSVDLTGYIPSLTFFVFNNNGDGGRPLNPVSEYSLQMGELTSPMMFWFWEMIFLQKIMELGLKSP